MSPVHFPACENDETYESLIGEWIFYLDRREMTAVVLA
jgi:hypothetical protein